MVDEPDSNEAWAEILRENWERRARSPDRDFFVASHPGWDDPERRESTARTEAEAMLLELDRSKLGEQDVLEIGCGVGRLATPLGEVFRSYTGVDIAPGMVEQARRTHAGQEDLRFLVGDGLTVPDEVRDRSYGLVLSVAVFTHCPREVIASLIRDAWALVQPGGVFRLQLRADPDDSTGIVEMPSQEAVHATASEVQSDLPPSQRELAEDVYYMGHAFAYDEVRPFLAYLVYGAITLYRTDRLHIYVSIKRI